MRARIIVFVVFAAVAATAASWTARWRPQPAPSPPLSAAASGGSSDKTAVPAIASSQAGPTAIDEGDIASRSSVTAPVGGRTHQLRRTPAASPPHGAVRPNPRVPIRLQPSVRRETAPTNAATDGAPPLSQTSATPNGNTPQPSMPATAPAGGESTAPGTAAVGPPSASGPSQPGVGPGSGASPDTGSATGAPVTSGPGLAATAPQTPVLAPPRVIATPGASYPGDAFRLTVRRQDLGAAAVVEGTEGTVTVRALVLATGELRSVEVTSSSGSDVLDRAAAKTVRGWRFAPAARDGAPIDAYVTLRIRYVVR